MKSSFERVVGVSEEGEEEILEREKDRFVNQNFEELKGKEREKTREEIEIISIANKITNKLRERYNLKDFDIPLDNFHIIKEEEWKEESRDAFCEYRYQAIVIREDENKLRLLTKIIHELIHFKGYNALQVVEETSEIKEYRVGFVSFSRDGKRVYFDNLNEAITEEITKRLFSEIIKDSFLKDEFQRTKETMEKYEEKYFLSGDTYYAKAEEKTSPKEDDLIEIKAIAFSYTKERKILNTLIDKLFEKNKDNFKDREEIFELFSKGAVTGNILMAGRLVDRTFGKGTFRKIGELDKNVEKMEEFVLSL